MNKAKEIRKPPTSDQKKLGKRIRQLRIKAGYSSYESFAYDKGLNRTQYAKYEAGRNITWDNLMKIIRAFNLSVSEFFSEGFEE